LVTVCTDIVTVRIGMAYSNCTVATVQFGNSVHWYNDSTPIAYNNCTAILAHQPWLPYILVRVRSKFHGLFHVSCVEGKKKCIALPFCLWNLSNLRCFIGKLCIVSECRNAISINLFEECRSCRCLCPEINNIAIFFLILPEHKFWCSNKQHSQEGIP